MRDKKKQKDNTKINNDAGTIERIFFILTFFNNILILIYNVFYLHGIARLIAPAVVARQGCHAGGGGAAARQRAVAGPF